MKPGHTARRPAAEDHAALYGAGFFETFRTRQGKPVRLGEHLERLRSACDTLGLRLPPESLAASPDPGRWLPPLRSLLERQGMEDGVFRLTVTAGENPEPLGLGDYLRPGERLSLRPLPPEPPAEGVSLHRLSTRRNTPEWLPRPKSLNYLNTLLAARELAPLRRHPADEGLMLDARGHISEAVFANLIWLRDGVAFTPGDETGRLPGIGAGLLIGRLRDSGVQVVAGDFPPEDLSRADCVALVSCVRGVVPVREILHGGTPAVSTSGKLAADGARFLRKLFES